jgi:NAD(P)H-dependent FMN reductase
MNDVVIGVVLGSSRSRRLGDRVCQFVLSQATTVAGASFTVLDLASYQLPFFDEDIAPLNNRDRSPAEPVRRWLGGMAAADGYLFLTPEYNYAVPAVLKNALDYLAREAEAKPASILSYSDTAHGGNIAGHELRLTLNKLGMFTMPKSLPLAHADTPAQRGRHHGAGVAMGGQGLRVRPLVADRTGPLRRPPPPGPRPRLTRVYPGVGCGSKRVLW